MKRILCLGDSNTFGYDPRSYFGSRYPAHVRWTGRLESAGWEVINRGENGLSIPGKEDFPELAERLRSQLPLDAIAVMLGSNDLLEGASPAETGARMEALLRCIMECAGDARIILIAPPPMERGEWVPDQTLIDRSAELGMAYRRLADKMGVTFTDAGAWNVSLAYDGVHFLPEGHAAFAGGLLAMLEDGSILNF